MTTALYLNEDVLGNVERTHPDPTKRGFRILIGDVTYALEIQRMARPADFVSLAEPAEAPTIDECANLIACIFQRMLMPSDPERVPGIPQNYRSSIQPPPGRTSDYYYNADGLRVGKIIYEDVSEREDGRGPDMEAGWNAYRKQLAETHACRLLPTWDALPSEVQEAFAVGVWAVMDPYLNGQDEERNDGLLQHQGIRSIEEWARESAKHVSGGYVDRFDYCFRRLRKGDYTFEQLAEFSHATSSECRIRLAAKLNQLVGKTIDGRAWTRKGKVSFIYTIGGAA